MVKLQLSDEDFQLLLNAVHVGISSLLCEADCLDSPGTPTEEDARRARGLRKQAGRYDRLEKKLVVQMAGIRQGQEHECEVCHCTEYRACPGGCAWSPRFLILKRWVCTNCEDDADPDAKEFRNEVP